MSEHASSHGSGGEGSHVIAVATEFTETAMDPATRATYIFVLPMLMLIEAEPKKH